MADGPLDPEFLGFSDAALSELMVFDGATSNVELDQRLGREVEAGVGRILELVGAWNAFDVIELLRLRELPVDPAQVTEPEFDGNSAVLELVALVLLARGRGVLPTEKVGNQPHEQIDELHGISARLLRLASYRALWAASLSNRGPLARLAGEYQSYFGMVRSHRYQSIERAHDAALFDRPDADELLSAYLGFTYGEFVLIRDAITSIYSTRMTDLRDRTGGLITQVKADGRVPTVDELDEFKAVMIDFMFLPGGRASFTLDDIAQRVDLGEETIGVVLGTFSSDFDDSVDLIDVVAGYLRGRNPLLVKSLVRDGAEHIMTTGPIGTDTFRVVAEAALKQNERAWGRYDHKIRSVVSEQLAVAFVGQLLRTDVVEAPLEYVAPKSGSQPASVDGSCRAPLSTGDLVEGDALFVVGDVAVCIEVKGRTIADAARRGDLARLESEVKSVFGAGANQARRLEVLIRENGGVWRKDATWLDLSSVREIHTVVVGLDNFGPLAVALGDLDGASLLGNGSLPWITSLHDLEVISKVVDRPAEFLLYLRRRTSPGIAANYRGVDELDFFMLFMAGGLYAEADPDEIHAAHRRTPAPTEEDRRLYRNDARSTLVGNHTRELDRWMYWLEGGDGVAVPKPVLNSYKRVVEFVDLLQLKRAPGWLRSGADLLAMAGEAQQQLVAALDDLVDRARQDTRFHTLAESFAGNAGYSILVAACAPNAMSLDESVGRLKIYTVAKKHQLEADRALGILLNERHQIVATIYLNDPPAADPELDDLVRALGLITSWTNP